VGRVSAFMPAAAYLDAAHRAAATEEGLCYGDADGKHDSHPVAQAKA
jgi:hypothetical protein